MKKKTAIHTHHSPYFYIIFAAVMVAVGITVTVTVTKVTGQTASEVIYACAQKQTGTLRMVAAGASCRQDENAVSWNIQGPQGPSNSTGLPFFCTKSCYFGGLADKFAGKDFSGVQLQNSYFTSGSDLSGVIFKGGYLQNVNFNNTNLTGADFSNIRDQNDINWHLHVAYIYFNGSNLTKANFFNSQFSNSDFTGVNLQNTNFSNALLSNDNFSKAQNMNTANVTGTTWDSVTCPDGTNSNNDGNTCAGHF
ncbi:MAG TPA: pentapeptide repeat-containing protein [Candidatus Acidoferrales bacterium]|nr:pentapeptide repeat-containing protein [Candidatus Acidoferrales bacterium]